MESLDEEEIRRAVRAVRPRVELCIKMDGGHFESQLKKYKQGEGLDTGCATYQLILEVQC